MKKKYNCSNPLCRMYTKVYTDDFCPDCRKKLEDRLNIIKENIHNKNIKKIDIRIINEK